MSGTKDILNRIKAVESTGKITKAMQLVSSSKMQYAQIKAKKGRFYSDIIAEGLNILIKNSETIENSLFYRRNIKNRGIILIASEKGLCGSLNANIFKLLIKNEKTENKSASYITVGKKAKEFINQTKRNLIKDFSFQDKISMTDINLLFDFILKIFLNKKIDTIEVIFPTFVNTLVQKPTIQKLIPLNNLKNEINNINSGILINSMKKSTNYMIFEPKIDNMLYSVINMFLKNKIYQTILEAKASEYSSRMVAMKNASDNAKELIDHLSLQYNKLRQSLITQEILEISASTQF